MDMLKQLEAKLGADSELYKKLKAQLMLKELEAKLGADSDVYKKVKAQIEAQQQSSAPVAPPQQQQPQSSAPAAPPQQPPAPRRPEPAPPAAAPRRGSRAKVSRTMEIDGHTVLCENNYDVTASHYEYGERPADPPRPAPAKKPRTERAAPAPRPPTAGELKRAAQNEALRAEMALAAPRRAAFFDGHRELLAPFTSGHVLDGLRAAAGAARPLAPRTRLVAAAPADVRATLRDYQLESLDWFADRHERCGALPCVLGDEMGLGKTLQTIAYLAWLKFEKRLPGAALVICPLSVLSTWLGECARWCPRLRVVKLHSSDVDERARLRGAILDDVGSYDVVVTTYEMAKAPSLRSALVQRVVWRAVVLDEGHVIKNRETEIAQTVRKMHFCTALLLTGTPLQNNLSELWGLLNFLYPAAFPCRDAFDAAYDLGRGVVDKAALGAARRLLGALMLRRLKADVEKGLPPKLETVVHCPLSHCQLFWYKALLLKDRDQLKLDDRGPAAGGYKSLVNLLMQLRKTCCHPFLFADAEGCDPGETTLEELVAASGKLRVLDRLLVKLHARKHRVVVFSQFASMVDVLDDYCALRGWPFCRLTGSTNRVQRVVNVRAFNEPSSPLFLFLMTTRAGGLGINLQSADTVVLYDSDWNPQADLQAMARVHRLGQTKPVHVYRLCSQGTAEERVLQRSQKKLFLSNMVNAAQQLGHDDAAVDDDDVGRLGGAEVLSMLRFGAASMFRGETNREPTDAELEGIIDRTRTGGAEETSGGLVGGVEASADTFDTSEEFVSTRELFGAEVKAPPRISHRDISEQWKHVVDGRRERKQRIKMVEGKGTGYGGAVPVLACNDYELEAGEASVFDRELKGANSDGAFAVQKRAMVIAGRDYAHEAEPLCCFGTGKRTSGPVLECAFCPMVFHKACAARGGYEDAGHLAAGKWRCPQHSCDVCARSTSAAGGLLFRCEACPATLCEDCLPEAATVVGESRRLVARGVPQQSAACYIRCSPKCDAIMAAREDSSRPSEEPTFAPLDLPPLEVDDRDEFAEAFLSERALGDGRPESFKERAAAAAADDVRLFDADLAATCADCGDGDEDAYDGEPRFRVAIKFRGGAPITAAAKTLARRNAAGRNVVHARLVADVRGAVGRGLLVPAPAARDAGGFFDEASGVMVVDGDSDDDGDDDIDGAFDASEDFAQDVALRRDGA